MVESRKTAKPEWFHCTDYLKLITGLRETRENFKTGSVIQKSEIAKQEIDLWLDYTKKRYEELPDTMKLSEKQIGYVRDPISRVTDRKTKKLKGRDIIEAHRLMVEEYDFDVKIDNEGMEKFMHPYHGYFTAIKDVQYTIDEIYDIY